MVWRSLEGSPLPPGRQGVAAGAAAAKLAPTELSRNLLEARRSLGKRKDLRERLAEALVAADARCVPKKPLPVHVTREAVRVVGVNLEYILGQVQRGKLLSSPEKGKAQDFSVLSSRDNIVSVGHHQFRFVCLVVDQQRGKRTPVSRSKKIPGGQTFLQ